MLWMPQFYGSFQFSGRPRVIHRAIKVPFLIWEEFTLKKCSPHSLPLPYLLAMRYIRQCCCSYIKGMYGRPAFSFPPNDTQNKIAGWDSVLSGSQSLWLWRLSPQQPVEKMVLQWTNSGQADCCPLNALLLCDLKCPYGKVSSIFLGKLLLSRQTTWLQSSRWRFHYENITTTKSKRGVLKQEQEGYVDEPTNSTIGIRGPTFTLLALGQSTKEPAGQHFLFI